MSDKTPISWFVSPPSRLRPIPEARARLLRPLWLALVLFAIVIDIAATLHVVRATYEQRPVFTRLGLDYEVQYRGEVWVGLPMDEKGPTLDKQPRLVAINGQPVSPDARISELTSRLEDAPGPKVTIDLRLPNGQVTRLEQTRRAIATGDTARRDLDFRIATRLIFALLACASLLFCSVMLAIRRPRDPVAMLFAFAFAAMAATIDPPLQLWMAQGWALANDILSSSWFYLLMLALATFPDGLFIPRIYRWLIPLGIPIAVFLSLEQVNGLLQAFMGISILLAMLTAQAIRFRRRAGGLEKQQIKWAAFGFTAGLLLIFGAFLVLAVTPEQTLDRTPLISLAVLVLFSTGMAAIPLGLLVALIRFRLWEADTIISRSAAYAFVTMCVGIVWAASADLAKLIIASIMGQQHEAGATAIGAIIAAGVFGPTQSAVLGWTRRRFGTAADKLAELPEQIKEWSLTESPRELGERILGLVNAALHPATASLALETESGTEEIASQSAETDETDPDRHNGPKLSLPLRRGNSLVGTLTLGPRTDGNRYGLKEREALQEIADPLATALRTSAIRHSREAGMQRTIEEMAARLAQLEKDGSPKPA